MNAPESLYNVQQVAQHFGVAASWVYAKAESGELPHYKVGRYVRFRMSEIEEYLRQRHRGGRGGR